MACGTCTPSGHRGGDGGQCVGDIVAAGDLQGDGPCLAICVQGEAAAQWQVDDVHGANVCTVGEAEGDAARGNVPLPLAGGVRGGRSFVIALRIPTPGPSRKREGSW